VVLKDGKLAFEFDPKTAPPAPVGAPVEADESDAQEPVLV
jgi:hypothetical protein